MTKLAMSSQTFSHWRKPDRIHSKKKYIGSFSSWRALTMTMTFWGGGETLLLVGDPTRCGEEGFPSTGESNRFFPCWIFSPCMLNHGNFGGCSATPSIGNKALKRTPYYGIMVLKNLIGIAQARNPSQKERSEIPTIHFQVWAVSFGKSRSKYFKHTHTHFWTHILNTHFHTWKSTPKHSTTPQKTKMTMEKNNNNFKIYTKHGDFSIYPPWN